MNGRNFIDWVKGWFSGFDTMVTKEIADSTPDRHLRHTDSHLYHPERHPLQTERHQHYAERPLLQTDSHLQHSAHGAAESSEHTPLDYSVAEYIRKKYRIADPDRCSDAEAARVMEVALDSTVTSTAGLARFTNLHTLKMQNVKISNLHLAGLQNLRSLSAENCLFFTVDLTPNSSLETVVMTRCRALKMIDLSYCNHLKYVSVNPQTRHEDDVEGDTRPVLYLPHQTRHSIVDSLSEVVIVEKWTV